MLYKYKAVSYYNLCPSILVVMFKGLYFDLALERKARSFKSKFFIQMFNVQIKIFLQIKTTFCKAYRRLKMALFKLVPYGTPRLVTLIFPVRQVRLGQVSLRQVRLRQIMLGQVVFQLPSLFLDHLILFNPFAAWD